MIEDLVERLADQDSGREWLTITNRVRMEFGRAQKALNTVLPPNEAIPKDDIEVVGSTPSPYASVRMSQELDAILNGATEIADKVERISLLFKKGD